MQTFTQLHTSEYYYECDEDSNGYSNTTFADNGGAITFENISSEISLVIKGVHALNISSALEYV